MNDREIYPQGWRAGDEEYIAENFNSLKKLYESAARGRMAIVQWIVEVPLSVGMTYVKI